MTLQISIDAQDARLDAMIALIATPAVLEILSGSPPTNCSSPDDSNILVTITLPIPWMLSASSGSVSKTGIWESISADMSGTAGHFRIYDVGGTNCQIQGTVSLTGDGGDMILDSLDITAGQDVLINVFTISDGNS